MFISHTLINGHSAIGFGENLRSSGYGAPEFCIFMGTFESTYVSGFGWAPDSEFYTNNPYFPLVSYYDSGRSQKTLDVDNCIGAVVF